MTRHTLQYRTPPDDRDVPEPGDVLRDEDTGTRWRVESIRPVSRGPNVGRKFVLDVTRIDAAGVPDGARIIWIYRPHRRAQVGRARQQ